jgi:hypothetical protein
MLSTCSDGPLRWSTILPRTLLVTALLAGCQGGVETLGPPVKPPDGTTDQGLLPQADRWTMDGTPEYGDPVVYAHSSDKLYKINPSTLEVMLVAPFSWPEGWDQMTDLAVDRKGKIVGISYSKLYAVNAQTAQCTLLSSLVSVGSQFNGLSFVPSSDPAEKEQLIGTALDGKIYHIDVATGQPTPIGSLGQGLSSSGDVVSVRGAGTLATLRKAVGANDWLARIDTSTGSAQLIGDTGFVDIWGLGYWKNRVYGFTQRSQLVLIDPQSGKGSLIATSGGPWWGAGVTTIAPVIE